MDNTRLECGSWFLQRPRRVPRTTTLWLAQLVRLLIEGPDIRKQQRHGRETSAVSSKSVQNENGMLDTSLAMSWDDEIEAQEGLREQGKVSNTSYSHLNSMRNKEQNIENLSCRQGWGSRSVPGSAWIRLFWTLRIRISIFWGIRIRIQGTLFGGKYGDFYIIDQII